MRRVVAGVVVTALALAGCVDRRPPVDDTALARPEPPTSPPTTPPTPTTTRPPCPPLATRTEPVPAGLREAIETRLRDPRFARNDVSASVWVEGWGEVAALQPDLRLLPASNQKLLTAMGALEVLGRDHRFVTSVRTAGRVERGVLRGDLVLVGGGDPTLRRTGPHSLAELARQVRAAGITAVTGSLLVDETRYDPRRDADGWLDWQRPAYAGALSAVIVDDNQYRSDAGFLADPALAGAGLFRDSLARQGVTVAGATAHGNGAGAEVARVESATSGQLVESMLLRSDNMIAESLVKEIDAVSGGTGSTAHGLARIRRALADRCVVVDGTDADGSGLSRANRRSAHEWRTLLATARGASWGPDLEAALPLAARSGTLAGRLTNMATAGNVRAKTGSIIPGRALSGYFTTAGGRSAVFSVIVNGDEPGPAQAAIDALVTTVASAHG